jgi:transposase
VAAYRGPSPFLSPDDSEQIVHTVLETVPQDHDLPGRGWTLRKLRLWVAGKLGTTLCRNTIRRVLRRAGLTWKKCKKLLGKANPAQREEFLRQFEKLYRQMCAGEVILIYVDEAHFHRDLDLGFSWGRKGERLWRLSDCPGLSEKINWYGAYNFTQGRCLIWNEGRCNSANTAQFLERIAEWLGNTDRPVIILWDGAPWHRAQHLKEKAQSLNIELIPLPGYSPDLNPIEGLWKWMREEVTQHVCHKTLEALFIACKEFIDTLNREPLKITQRLWPRFELDPQIEKLRLSI